MTFEIIENDDGVFVSSDNENRAYSFDIYPLDSMRSKPPEKLTQVISECLKTQLEERGSSVNTRSLLGECHKNARNLFDHLYERGYNPDLIIGCNRSAGRAAGVRQSFKEIRNIHQWVEIDSYIVEICSEASSSTGKLYISKNKPSNYNEYIRLSKIQVNSLPVQYITADNIDSVLQFLQN